MPIPTAGAIRRCRMCRDELVAQRVGRDGPQSGAWRRLQLGSGRRGGQGDTLVGGGGIAGTDVFGTAAYRR